MKIFSSRFFREKMIEKYFSSKKSKVIQISVTYPKMSFQLLLSAENGLFEVKRYFFFTAFCAFGSQPRDRIHIYESCHEAEN